VEGEEEGGRRYRVFKCVSTVSKGVKEEWGWRRRRRREAERTSGTCTTTTTTTTISTTSTSTTRPLSPLGASRGTLHGSSSGITWVVPIDELEYIPNDLLLAHL